MAHKKRRRSKHFGVLPVVFGLPLLPVLAGLAATGLAAFLVLKKKKSSALVGGSSLVISPNPPTVSLSATAERRSLWTWTKGAPIMFDDEAVFAVALLVMVGGLSLAFLLGFLVPANVAIYDQLMSVAR